MPAVVASRTIERPPLARTGDTGGSTLISDARPGGLPAGRVVGMLEQGDSAPDLTLLDQNGEPFSLSESIKRQTTRWDVTPWTDET